MNAPNASTQTIDGRKSDRFGLNAPVFFFWEPPNGSPQSNQGITRDVSATGVYVHADETPSVGELVEIDILLPTSSPHTPEIHVTGEGVVLRAEPRSGEGASASKAGFAIEVKFHPELSELVLSCLREYRRSGKKNGDSFQPVIRGRVEVIGA